MQLTHSGRWSRPGRRAGAAHRVRPSAARCARRRERAPACFSDDELDELVERYVDAAVLARQAGFDFVDVKHCHGYLLHELLSARGRGRAGTAATSTGRTRFLRSVVAGIRSACAGSGDRRAAVDVRFRAVRGRATDGRGVPAATTAATRTHSAVTARDSASTSTETHALLDVIADLGHRAGVHDGGQPVLQPAHPAARVLPAVRRLSAARGSAGGRRPPDSAATRNLPRGIPASRSSDRGIRTCRTGCRTSRRRWWPAAALDGRARPHGAVVSAAGGRRAGRTAAANACRLPHVQRLHDGAAQRPGLGLLPARPVLQGSPRTTGNWRTRRRPPAPASSDRRTAKRPPAPHRARPAIPMDGDRARRRSASLSSVSSSSSCCRASRTTGMSGRRYAASRGRG